ncbi:phage tail assembly protein T [Streptomyces cinereospinus]|uniref:DUF4035 domain-containing protein n=1 Tax=Streptomyces cinereospinus TaxID=285561 RepID=A0ABV5N2L6_9ACTN
MFYFRLAAHLGGMTVRELLARTSSSELAEWRAFEMLTGPLGPARGDVQAALVASVVAGVHRSKGAPPKVSDFMPRWDRQRVRKSPEELFRMAQQANAALGGRFNTTTA